MSKIYHLWARREVKFEIEQAPGNVRQRLRRCIHDLAEMSRPANSKQMKSVEQLPFELRRIRLENWRILYLIDEQTNEIGILAIRKRPPYDYSDLQELLQRH